MKHCIHAVFFVLISISLQAQPARLSGQLLAEHTSDITFLSNISGIRQDFVSDPLGKFSVRLDKTDKGFYSLGDVLYIYLEPGFDLQMTITPDSTYVFSGKGSEENNMMVELRKRIGHYLPSSSYSFYTLVTDMDVTDFFSRLNAYKKEADQRISNISDKTFRDLLHKDFDFYVRTKTREYQYGYGIDSVQQISFFKLIQSKSYTDAMLDSASRAMYRRQLTKEEDALLDSAVFAGLSMEDENLFKNSSAYRTVVDYKITNEIFSKVKDPLGLENEKILRLQYIPELIRNSFIRNYLLYRCAENIMLSSMSSDADKEAGYKKFSSLQDIPATYKKQIETLYGNFKAYADQKPAPDFNYKDIHGKDIRLAHLKGKYVYIDVWATWCGPCKAEIPFLTKMEEEYKNRNIHFVSLSVDNPSDQGKWKEYVTKNNLKGIQLMADKAFESDFVKRFNIMGIPRFILIDPQGVIVSANAKRPSDPELKQQLNGLL